MTVSPHCATANLPIVLSHQDAFLGKKELAISRLTSVTLLNICYFRNVEHGMERMVWQINTFLQECCLKQCGAKDFSKKEGSISPYSSCQTDPCEAFSLFARLRFLTKLPGTGPGDADVVDWVRRGVQGRPMPVNSHFGFSSALRSSHPSGRPAWDAHAFPVSPCHPKCQSLSVGISDTHSPSTGFRWSTAACCHDKQWFKN